MLTFLNQGDPIFRVPHSVLGLLLALLQRTGQLVLRGLLPEYRYHRHHDGTRSGIPLHLSPRAQEAESESGMIEKQTAFL